MKVILTEDVDALGANGDVLDVADGYARNYLLPKNYAIQATKGAMEDLNRRIERIKAKAEKKHQEDLKKAEKIESIGPLKLEAKAGETGKLFGTITTKELAAVVTEKSGIEVERRNLNLDNPINMVGEYVLNIRISAKVAAKLDLHVGAIKAKEDEFRIAEAFAEPEAQEEPAAEKPEETKPQASDEEESKEA